MTAGEGVAAVLVLAITLYAWSGLADYGAGCWDLLAGGRARGRQVRALIDNVITPVWEANHVWLVFILVASWTAFGVAFASIMTTLFIPLALAAFGIVLRGANFALRKEAARRGARHLTGWAFGVGSVLTPFCLGAALGGVVAGRGPPGNQAGDELTSWWNPTGIAVGLLAVAIGAYLSATYLVAESRRRGLPELAGYFRRRALVTGPVGLVVGAVALATLYLDQRAMFDRFLTRSSVLLVAGVVALGLAFWLAARSARRGMRVAAAAGVAALVWGWAVAQYPYLLPFELDIAGASGAALTQRWVLTWAAVALVLVGPALVLLYVLDQRGDLDDQPRTVAGDEAA